MAKTRSKKTAFYLLRLVVCIALVAFVLLLYDRTEIGLHLKNVNFGYLLLAWALNYVSIFLSTLRWQSILNRFGDKTSLARLWSLYVEGQFFNLLFPGFVAGDMSRVARTSVNSKISTTAVMSVFLERFFGMVTFCLFLGVVALFGGFRGLAPVWYLIIAGFAVLGVSALIFLFNLNLLNRFTRFLPAFLRPRAESLLEKSVNAVKILTQHKELLWQLPFYSLLFILMSGPVAYLAARSVGVDIPLSIFMIFAPLIAFVSNLPISIAGVGVRENLAVHFYVNLGYQPEEIVAYALAQSAILFLVNLSGGIFLLYRSAKTSSKVLQQHNY